MRVAHRVSPGVYDKRPVAALVPLEEVDRDSRLLSRNADFVGLIKRSRYEIAARDQAPS
jgi:hypothetical protein